MRSISRIWLPERWILFQPILRHTSVESDEVSRADGHGKPGSQVDSVGFTLVLTENASRAQVWGFHSDFIVLDHFIASNFLYGSNSKTFVSRGNLPFVFVC